MELSDFQRKAVLLIFISILIGAILLARKEPLKKQSEKGVAPMDIGAPSVPPTPIPTKIDINTADINQIMQLPGIGPGLAKEIIKYRPYSKIEDLLKVPGIGEKRLARIRDMVDLPGAKEDVLKGVAPMDIGALPVSEAWPRPYDSRIDPNVKCPHCGKQLWEKGKRKQEYIRCPQCLKLL